MLERNRHLVEALRDSLLECQELVGDEIGAVIVAAQEAHDAVLGGGNGLGSPRSDEQLST